MSSPSWLRLAGPIDASVARRIDEQLADRAARGVTRPEETLRVASTPVRLFAADGVASEAFRRACLLSNVERPVKIFSHRRFFGPVVVAIKRFALRFLRYQHHQAWEQQHAFNRETLTVLRQLADRLRERGSSTP